MLEIIPIPAFQDNYIWLLKHGAHTVVVDPGDAAPVMAILKNSSLTLEAILITHHHSDHIDGVVELLKYWPKAHVYAPKREDYSFLHQPVVEGDIVRLRTLDLELTVMETPGHTLDILHITAHRYCFAATLYLAGDAAII